MGFKAALAALGMGQAPRNRVFSLKELAQFDGQTHPEIYLSFFGVVYDVSSRGDLYGLSPPGPYHIFAGRECARALCTMSIDPADVGSTDLEDLGHLTEKLARSLSAEEVREAVQKARREWQEKLSASYRVVGLLRSGPGEALPPPAKHHGLRGHDLPGPEEPLLDVTEPTPGPLELLSRKPRAYLQRHFLSPAACRRLISMTLKRQAGASFEKKVRAALELDNPGWSDDERAFLYGIEERLAEMTGGPIHPDEAALVGTLTPPGGGETVASHLGLHVDTNAAPWRFCTAIVYLSTVSAGGETVFPAACSDGVLPTEEEEAAVEAGGALLELGVDHTEKALLSAGGPAAHEAAQVLLSSAARGGGGLSVRPEEGSVCLFWTRLDDGEIDPHSWHGGAPVTQRDAFKWTLQKFKEVPSSVRQDPLALADFCRRTRRAALLQSGGH